MALGVALAVAGGDIALGHVKVEERDVLYLASRTTLGASRCDRRIRSPRHHKHIGIQRVYEVDLLRHTPSISPFL